MITKAQILSEIKRTAIANGGQPLGSRKFEAETSVKTSDWLGKFWARWGDAVREAGFAPNQLQGAYESDDLLEKFAVLAQELGRLPTANDLRLKDRQDPSFPNQKVFERLGNKRQLVQRVLEWSRARPEFENVVTMCQAYAPRHQAPDVVEANVKSQSDGYVYLIKHGARREYKIGHTNNVLRREGEISVELPEKVEPVHVIKTDDPTGIEAYWHKRFATKRKNGEWFDLTPADVAAFKRRRFM